MIVAVAVAAVIASAALWFGAGLPALVALTTDVLSWCSGILSSCLSAMSVASIVLVWGATALVASGVVYSIIKNSVAVARGYAAMMRLPVVRRSGSIILLREDSLQAAFTHGLARPRIYITTGLMKGLTAVELRSVVLHEAHHRRMRDPLRFLAATVVKDALFYLPAGVPLLTRFLGARERLADDSVVLRTSDPLILAGALLKVAVSGTAGRRAPSPVSIRGNAGASIEGRIRRLVEGTEGTEERVGVMRVAASVVVAVVMAVCLLMPVSSTALEPASCTTDHCSTHMSEMDENCTAHCEVKGTAHHRHHHM